MVLTHILNAEKHWHLEAQDSLAWSCQMEVLWNWNKKEGGSGLSQRTTILPGRLLGINNQLQTCTQNNVASQIAPPSLQQTCLYSCRINMLEKQECHCSFRNWEVGGRMNQGSGQTAERF